MDCLALMGSISASDCQMDRPASHEACGLESAPQYLIRDRDKVYGEAFTRRVRAMGIRDRPTAPRLLWQNGYAEPILTHVSVGLVRRQLLF
jgi:hypothetical protein